MVGIFADFTQTLVIFGVILAVGIIFEEKFITLEDKLDTWIKTKKQERKAHGKSGR